MTKILITGSSGFLGSRLAYYLKDKYELLLPSHGELNARIKMKILDDMFNINNE